MNKLATMSFWLFATMPATAQEPATPFELVAQLAAPEMRADARLRLRALGRQAVPALAGCVGTYDKDQQTELLALLVELGPDAGAAVPQLLAVALRPGAQQIEALVWALGELAPYRAPEVEIDEPALSRANLDRRMQKLPGGEDTMIGVASQRLRKRLAFPRAADVDTLLVIVQGYNAFRVELAIEHLGQRGAAARAALPLLRRLLERPEPKILTTERTVPIHRKAALAVLAIGPIGADADLARAVLAGEPFAPAAVPAIPERAQARITELLAELEVPAKRGAAAANLVAFGKLAAPAVATALLQRNDVDFREAALAILHDTGPRAAFVVPQLLDALFTLSTDHTASVLRALQAAGPWCTDVVPGLDRESRVGSLRILGRQIAGAPDVDCLNAVETAAKWFGAAMAVDPSCSLVELGTLLESPTVANRECALAVLRERGSEARPLLPALTAMLTSDQPKFWSAERVDAQGIRSAQVDRSEHIHRLAAHAIVAIAAADDPLVAQARTVIARPEPK